MTGSDYERTVVQEVKDLTEFALVINGHSLVHALSHDCEQTFVNISTYCEFT